MRNNFVLKITILVSILFLFLLPAISFAQMFSIDDDEPRRERVLGAITIAGIGWEIGDFSYQGDTATETQRLDFNESLFRVRLESPGLDVGLAFGGAFTGMDNHSYVNLSARIYNDFPLKRSEKFLLLLPIQLTTDLKQVRRNISDAEFQQSSLILGTGLATVYRLSNRMSLQAKATPNYGFSFSQGSLFGGSLFRVDGRIHFIIDNLIGNNALTFGYHFDYRQYRIEGDLNDYDFNSHSFTIGIGF